MASFMKSMGGVLGGSKGRIGAQPQQAAPNPYTQDAAINNALRIGIDQQNQSAAYGAQIPGLINQLGEAPVMDTAGQTELDAQAAVNKRIMDMARLNASNTLAQQIGGARSGITAAGGVGGGAYEASLGAGAMARGQAGLNQLAAQQSQQMLDVRSSILANIYQRLSNKTSAVIGQQAQSASLSEANIGTSINKTMFDQKLAFDRQQLASQERMAKEQAKAVEKAGNQSMWSNIIGGGMGMLSSIFTGGLK
jgi:hypothetical protein